MISFLTNKKPIKILLFLLSRERTMREICRHLNVGESNLRHIIPKLKEAYMIRTTSHKPMKYLLTENGRKVAELLRIFESEDLK